MCCTIKKQISDLKVTDGKQNPKTTICKIRESKSKAKQQCRSTRKGANRFYVRNFFNKEKEFKFHSEMLQVKGLLQVICAFKRVGISIVYWLHPPQALLKCPFNGSTSTWMCCGYCRLFMLTHQVLKVSSSSNWCPCHAVASIIKLRYTYSLLTSCLEVYIIIAYWFCIIILFVINHLLMLCQCQHILHLLDH